MTDNLIPTNEFGTTLNTIQDHPVIPKNKKIFLLYGKKDCRLKTSFYFLEVLKNQSEALQFGFFLKTYAAKIIGKEENFVTDNKYNLVDFTTEDILHKILDCVNDTAVRLGQKEIEYNKMALLSIFNYLFNKAYRLEHEIEQEMTVDLYALIKQIGQIWKLVFTETVWSDLVITAIRRSNFEYIIVDDFRFKEEYIGLVNEKLDSVYTVKIIDTIQMDDEMDESEFNYDELSKFPFDYIINCTIPNHKIITNYIEPQIMAICEDINFELN